MLIRWRSYDPTMASFASFRRRMDQLFEDFGRHETSPSFYESRWPYINLDDAGDKLLLTAEIPGMNEDQVNLTLNQDVLSISGERVVDGPKGYTAHRKERGNVRFSRSFSLPCKVDPEKVAARLTNGVLTVEIAKAPEAQPRQITVQAGS